VAFGRSRQKLVDVLQRIDVKHQPRYAQNARGNAFNARLFKVSLKTAGSKAALDYVGRGSRKRVGAGSVGGRHNYDTRPRGRGEPLKILRPSQWYVDWDQKRRGGSRLNSAPACGIGRNAVTQLFAFFENQHARTPGMLDRIRIAGNNYHAIDAFRFE
jgi:hypothetical protein